ncbi:uncharacterized protein [Chelonus insularis]|uniref:uncharacterized protein n=1 Tax=Chelonus insularis TaxID=460826 RepID=UPI00158F2FA5|nr:uncharacterized protein LOC118066526 [Chelonus insularis]
MPSAWIDNKLKREINVYWHNVGFQHGDTLAIYIEKPNNDTEFLWEFQPTVQSGFARTGQYISLLHKYALTSYKEEILVFCGAWLRNGEIKKVNCLSTHPTWMHDRKMILKDQKLTDLIIPGTYMSGLYIKTLPPQETAFETFTVSQNQDILTQLVHGARYLDISIGYFPHLNQSYWDILFFLNSTKEIVMLAFRNFSMGFKNSRDHKNFVDYLKKKFSHHLLIQQNPNDQWSITLGEIWALDKRLIIVYERILYVMKLSGISAVSNSVQQVATNQSNREFYNLGAFILNKTAKTINKTWLVNIKNNSEFILENYEKMNSSPIYKRNIGEFKNTKKPNST